MFHSKLRCKHVDLTAALYGSGKADLIKKWQLGTLILASGDSRDNFELLESVTDPAGIKLIINTIPSNESMLGLYKKYSAGMVHQSYPRVLIQGTDRSVLSWIPTAYSKGRMLLKYTKTEGCQEYISDIIHEGEWFDGYKVDEYRSPAHNPSSKSACGYGGCNHAHHSTGIPAKAHCEKSVHKRTPCGHVHANVFTDAANLSVAPPADGTHDIGHHDNISPTNL